MASQALVELKLKKYFSTENNYLFVIDLALGLTSPWAHNTLDHICYLLKNSFFD